MILKILLIGILMVFSATAFGSGERIRFSFDNKEIIVALDENGAAESLLEQLPLELKFENYGSVEKISYLPKELDISRAPDSCTPSAGDLTYYSPWGNLAFFHKGFRHSRGLIPLGKIESGIEELQNIDKAATVKIEQLNK